jgi:hypothetical protein
MCSVIENHHQPLMCFFKEIWLNDRRIYGLIWKLKIARGNFQFSLAFQLVEIQNQRERERERERSPLQQKNKFIKSYVLNDLFSPLSRHVWFLFIKSHRERKKEIVTNLFQSLDWSDVYTAESPTLLPSARN